MIRRLRELFDTPAVALTGLVLLAGIISLTVFNGESLRLDESQSLWQTARPILGEQGLLKIVSKDVHVPLYHVLLHGWQLLFGNGVGVDRLLSTFFFLLTIPAVYLLGTEAFGGADRRAPLYAAALTALSPFLMWYGSELRMYSLLALLTALNQYAYLRLANRPGKTAGLLYAGTALLGIYTHYLFFAYLAVQGIFTFWKRRSLTPTVKRTVTAAAVLTVVAIAPWVAFVLGGGSANQTRPNLAGPSTVDLFNTFGQFFIGFQGEVLNTALISLWPLAALAIIVALQRGRRPILGSTFLAVSSLLPIALVFLASQAYPFYLSRYLIFTLPAFYLALAYFIGSFGKGAPLLRAVILALTAAGLTVQASSAAVPVRENYQTVARALTSSLGPRDLIVIVPPFTIYPIDYYYAGTATLQTFPGWDRNNGSGIPPFTPAELDQLIVKAQKQYARTCVVFSYDQGFNQRTYLSFERGLERIDEKRFSPDLIVRCYRPR